MKIYLDTIGCRLNQAEIESVARQFRLAGHEVVPEPGQAELAVINTCTVTRQADADSRQKLRQMSRAGVGQIVATGCWATLHPAEAAALPGLSDVIPNELKEFLVPELLRLPRSAFDLEPLEREPLPGARLRTRAFIKAQDGCDNHCTYCITTLARGPGRSQPVGAVLADVRSACRGSAQEAVLTGVHLGSWGGDLTPPQRLDQLVKALLSGSDIPRLRLSSLEPWDLDSGFLQLWENPRLCRHLHLPLQSGCAATLRRMGRKTTHQAYADLLVDARQAIPGVAITTDIMVGFPGEDEVEFAESLEFVTAMQFAAGHVFTYSERPGTPAAHLPGSVPQTVRKERSVMMRSELKKSAVAFRSRFLGCVMPVLWESTHGYGPQGWEISGLTDNYLRVNALSTEPISNRITPVLLTELTDDGLQGQILTNP